LRKQFWLQLSQTAWVQFGFAAQSMQHLATEKYTKHTTFCQSAGDKQVSEW
jgi:hypothetical protein